MPTPSIFERMIRDKEQIFTLLNWAMSCRGAQKNDRNQKGSVFHRERIFWCLCPVRPLQKLSMIVISGLRMISIFNLVVWDGTKAEKRKTDRRATSSLAQPSFNSFKLNNSKFRTSYQFCNLFKNLSFWDILCNLSNPENGLLSNFSYVKIGKAH